MEFFLGEQITNEKTKQITDDSQLAQQSIQTPSKEKKTMENFVLKGFREQRLLIEYKQFLSDKNTCPSGVYVTPSLNDSSLFHGIIFIREGKWKNAIFRFEIYIPEFYPNEGPKVFFKNKVFHPQIDPNTNELNLTKQFGKWNPKNHFLWQIPRYIKKIFYQIDLNNEETDPNILPSLNNEAILLLKTNEEEFKKKASESAETSIEQKNLYLLDKNNILSISDPTVEHELHLKEIRKQYEIKSIFEEKEKGITDSLSSLFNSTVSAASNFIKKIDLDLSN